MIIDNNFFKITVLNLHCLIKIHSKIYNPCNYFHSVTVYSLARKSETFI